MRVLPLFFVLAACGGGVRDYPRWTVADQAPSRADCVDVQGFVRVSGKTGVGMTLMLRSYGDCQVKVARADFVVGDQRIGAELPPAQALTGRSLVYLWLPFAFDNNQAWNRGDRTGQFEIVLETNGVAAAPLVLPAEHRFVHGRWKPDPRGSY